MRKMRNLHQYRPSQLLNNALGGEGGVGGSGASSISSQNRNLLKALYQSQVINPTQLSGLKMYQIVNLERFYFYHKTISQLDPVMQ